MLVADSTRARIVREPGSHGQDTLEDLTFETEHRQPREIMADRQGRAFASMGRRRSGIEPHSDPEREQEEAFARKLVDELSRRHAAGEFDALAIIAEPRMLGMIRSRLSGPIGECVAGELAKDLTKLPVPKLRKAILDSGILGAGARQ